MGVHNVRCLQLHISLVSISHNDIHNISLGYRLQLMVKCSAKCLVICLAQFITSAVT